MVREKSMRENGIRRKAVAYELPEPRQKISLVKTKSVHLLEEIRPFNPASKPEDYFKGYYKHTSEKRDKAYSKI